MLILMTCVEGFEFLGFSWLDSYWPVLACSSVPACQAALVSTCQMEMNQCQLVFQNFSVPQLSIQLLLVYQVIYLNRTPEENETIRQFK